MHSKITNIQSKEPEASLMTLPHDLTLPKRDFNTRGRFSAIYTKATKEKTVFTYLHLYSPVCFPTHTYFWKGIYSKRLEFVPNREQIISFYSRPVFGREIKKKHLIELPVLIVYQFLLSNLHSAVWHKQFLAGIDGQRYIRTDQIEDLTLC